MISGLAGVVALAGIGASAACEPSVPASSPVARPTASHAVEEQSIQGFAAEPTVSARPSPTRKPVASPPVKRTAARPVRTTVPVATPAPKPKPTPVIRTAPAAKSYPNCKELNVDYPHGVGRPGAADHTSGRSPVTTFTRNQVVYDANTARDRDGDGIACEKQ